MHAKIKTIYLALFQLTWCVFLSAQNPNICSHTENILESCPEQLYLDDSNNQTQQTEDDTIPTRSGCKKIKKPLHVKGNAQFCKNVEIDESLTVDGLIDAQAISFNESITIGSCTGLTGDLSIGNTLNVCDTVNASGDLSVEGNFNVCSQDLCCKLLNRPTALFAGLYAGSSTGTVTIPFPSSYFASEPIPPVAVATSANNARCVMATIPFISADGCTVSLNIVGNCEPEGTTPFYLLVAGYPGTGYCPVNP
jgi:hypothetical protein